MIQNAIASVAVNDVHTAAEWYERLFQRPPDSCPMAELAEWKFPRGGWLQVYQLPERAGHCSCTLAVDDLDAVTSHVAKLGIDGNSLAFAQTLDPTMAQ